MSVLVTHVPMVVPVLMVSISLYVIVHQDGLESSVKLVSIYVSPLFIMSSISFMYMFACFVVVYVCVGWGGCVCGLELQGHVYCNRYGHFLSNY